jgi:hypothetical protein
LWWRQGFKNSNQPVELSVGTVSFDEVDYLGLDAKREVLPVIAGAPLALRHNFLNLMRAEANNTDKGVDTHFSVTMKATYSNTVNKRF